MKFTVPEDQLNKIIYAYHHDPFEVLGPHVVDLNGAPAVSVRAFLPTAEQAWVVPGPDAGLGETPSPMARRKDTGFFEAQFSGQAKVFPYELRFVDKAGDEFQGPDTYSFPPVLGDLDLHLFAEGNHYRTYDRLGAHVMAVEGVQGVHFAVWAPNAMRVSVVGDFNHWDGRRNAMRVRGGTGVWELFVPGLGEGTIYKFEIKTRYDTILTKADPQAFFSEVRPKTASVVWNIDKHTWQDEEWMAQRAAADHLHAPSLHV